MRQAVILAGGLGTRMRPLTITTPKPMILIHGKPFLEYIIESLKKNNISEIVLLVGYLHEKIENYFGNGKKFGVNIKYSYSLVETDTGARLRNAKSLLQSSFLLLYGDNYWPLRLNELTTFYESMGKKMSVVVYNNLDNATKNNMFVNSQKLVEQYDRSRKSKNLNGVDIGFFILRKELVTEFSLANFSFEDVIIPKLIKQKQLAGFKTFHKYYGLSNFERIPIIENFFKHKKIVFLDRDGVINEKPPQAQYIKKWKEFKFLPKAMRALQVLQKKGYTIFIVTNQAGIGRGIMTQQQVDTIHNNLIKELKLEGIVINDIFLCPHDWNEGCFCRKPNPGMFYTAANKYNINLFESYCIGDDPRDIIAGSRAGCKTILLGNVGNEILKTKPNLIFKDLFEAAKNL